MRALAEPNFFRPVLGGGTTQEVPADCLPSGRGGEKNFAVTPTPRPVRGVVTWGGVRSPDRLRESSVSKAVLGCPHTSKPVPTVWWCRFPVLATKPFFLFQRQPKQYLNNAPSSLDIDSNFVSFLGCSITLSYSLASDSPPGSSLSCSCAGKGKWLSWPAHRHLPTPRLLPVLALPCPIGGCKEVDCVHHGLVTLYEEFSCTSTVISAVLRCSSGLSVTKHSSLVCMHLHQILPTFSSSRSTSPAQETKTYPREREREKDLDR